MLERSPRVEAYMSLLEAWFNRIRSWRYSLGNNGNLIKVTPNIGGRKVGIEIRDGIKTVDLEL
jgi:hypothetical protein